MTLIGRGRRGVCGRLAFLGLQEAKGPGVVRLRVVQFDRDRGLLLEVVENLASDLDLALGCGRSSGSGICSLRGRAGRRIMGSILPGFTGTAAELKRDHAGAGGQNPGSDQDGDHDRFDLRQDHGLHDSFGERRDGKRDGRRGGDCGTALGNDRQRGIECQVSSAMREPSLQLGSGQMGRQGRRGDRDAPAGKPRAKQVARP